ncbi:cytochrome d ubiquinol oxidase subunit II [Streptosporangium becharense]|uniref:Cytochrome d ubiquinol oxidase subunit II n=1 Tax=Streptosporangium becharense TaxID=1816182 RepID=A0A7W9ILV9_9ACTN|nr:cytochrome d ubiquinol oxidase subunit II [Streptosporangium becharense]MBB2911738.1 cytochrome d ubiquinol oxidase subunit II [Streptosporangium becharense]MBB5822444.1 cytochrome d ubiquinol oxidase subunit II [Streptosporangium becharense]
MELTTFWFAVIAFLWTGYFVLEGFDFGVGMLVPVLSRSEAERKQVLGTIGPVWDGNEVWLITAVGAMFAAFPAWYAGLLSEFYLPVMLVLVGLIVRGVGLEWRGKVQHSSDRAWCDTGVLVGSALPAFLWGAVFADLLRNSATAALAGGVFSLSLCLLHGAVFVALKTTGPVRARARRAALIAAVVAVPSAVVVLSGIPASGGSAAGQSGAVWVWACALTSVAALAAGVALTWRGRDGWAFAATASSIVLASAALFGALWPAPFPGLTVAEAASGPYTLGVLTWIGLIALPFVLGYQAWSYWVFRKRLTAGAS